MKTLSAAALALTLTGGAASAQMNPCNLSFGPCSQSYYGAPAYLYGQPHVGSPFPDQSVLIDTFSGAALQRNRNMMLQNELLRRQLQQGR